MKVIITITAISFIAIVIAYDQQTYAHMRPTSGSRCPLVDGENATLIRHPTNCSIYYHCDMGHAVEMQCPYGLHFNNCAKVCDWPYRACCDPIYDPDNNCRICE